MAEAWPDKTDTRWRRLHAIIETHALMRGDFTLTSGRKSTYLFQLRQATMLAEGQVLIGELIVDAMRAKGLHTVGGLELGAVPLVTAAAFASHLAGFPVDAFFVRKEAKKHGAKERIDGYCREGAEVLVVDDVTTTGGSTLVAVEAIRAERGCTVRWALSIVDREEGAGEALRAAGITLLPLFRKSDFAI